MRFGLVLYGILMAACLTVVDTVEAISVGGEGSIGVVDRSGGERGVGNVSGVVGMSGGNSVGVRKSSSNLADGVGISVSIPLADGMESGVSGVSRVSNMGSIGVVDSVGGIRGVGDVSGVVGMSGGNSVGVWKSSGNLADGVGISISVSLSLVEVVDRGGISGSIGGVGVS